MSIVEDRTEMICTICGQFSSSRVCWCCSQILNGQHPALLRRDATQVTTLLEAMKAIRDVLKEAERTKLVAIALEIIERTLLEWQK